VYVIGDIHGHYGRLVALLQNARLMGDDLAWAGGDEKLWFIGDFFDRGPDGIGVLNLVMRLQREAETAGGRVQALVGNHELTLLSAHYFGQQTSTGPGRTFLADWKRNGGVDQDLARLTDRHIDWLSRLPAMIKIDGKLLAHADALAYTRYGLSVDEVNSSFAALLQSDDAKLWDETLEAFSEHEAFIDSREDGTDRARAFLRVFGAEQLIHGHTPISKVTRQSARSVTSALIYADGLCINVDGGIYQGGPGFVYETPNLV
jgi:calcineurin-like phosphoesterase family protein